MKCCVRPSEPRVRRSLIRRTARSSYQRGTNEHHNGRLRRYYPKGTDFTNVSEEGLQDAITVINNQPRKCLGWLSPA